MAISRLKQVAFVALAMAVSLWVFPAPARAAGPACATPGRDGAATITGVVDTYYPGSATAAAGSASLTLGTSTGSSAPIAIGDLVLVIQMQDAAINSTNTGAYGDGVAGDPATGSTALNSSGLYEYAVATSAVPLAGGALTISSGLINTYTSAAASASQGARHFQVVRVPQYAAATLTSGLTAAAFNGSTGGVLAFDVAAGLTLNGAAVSVSQEGFRAGLGRQLAGGAGGGGTDYVGLSANPFHGQKGEGIAGTSQYLYDSRTGGTVNNGSDGYPNGSTARGAPGNAGGGGTDPDPAGNDQNTGGGGGANGGAGGMGGNSWLTNIAVGGFGGTAFAATAGRVALGAGGGAGSRNNSGAIANASSGGNGGGIVLIRSGSVTGTGSITADGGTGVAPDNDGGGGGGAGGSVVVATRLGGLGGLTVSARGGAGTNAWATGASGTPAGANYHGPGGGGGGGVVLTTSAAGTVAIGGGLNGTTTVDQVAYGATPGAPGAQGTITAAQIPGAGSGADCSPDLTIAKSHTDPFVRGSTGSYALTVSNVGGVASSGTVTVTDTVPAGLTPTAASGTGWSCTIAAQAVSCMRADAVAAGAAFPTVAVTVAVSQSAAASLTNTATVAGGGEFNTTNDSASDLTSTVARADIAITKVASSGAAAVGSNVTFTVSAQNIGPSDATGVQVTDQLPAGLTLVSASTLSGTYTGATGVWNIGALSSGTTATLTLVATVTAPGNLTNTATKTAETENDPNIANDSASASVTGQAPDLTIAKSHVDPLTRGGNGTYNLLVSNIGQAPGSGTVTVNDALPAGLTPIAASGTGWICSIAAQAVTCTRSDALAAGAAYPAISLLVSVAQTATSPLSNTATVGGGGEFNLTNDSATDPTTIASIADMALTKTASRATVPVGGSVSYTVTASDMGPSNATGLQVTDQLPAALTFVSASPSAGTYNSTTGVWNIGNLANGASATMTITATVTGTGVIVNTASRTAENETDNNPRNDVSSASITGQPTATVPGPPSSGMAMVSGSSSRPLAGLLAGILVGLLLALAFRKRSGKILMAAGAVAIGALVTLSSTAPVAMVAARVPAQQAQSAIPSDLQLFGKAISTEKPTVGTLLPALHPAYGAVTPTRIRIPALNIDTTIEAVGLTRSRTMDVPGNIWNAAWLRNGVLPGASGQAVIDGHLDSTRGSAVFIDLKRLKAGDRIYVSDAEGAELTFRVTALQVAPLNGFPALQVFGPSRAHALNLITCAGKYDAAHRTYDHRLIVFTTLLS